MSEAPMTWMAGDGEGVVLVCNGNCPQTPAGDLVVAEYGATATEREGVERFSLGDLSGFMSAANRHAYNCRPIEAFADDEPHWGPLRTAIPLDQCDGWMWMARSVYDGNIVEHYKHRETRGSITLGHDGTAWKAEIAEHGCTPWCEETHEHLTDVYAYSVITIEAAFDWADVWPWQSDDPVHGLAPWLRPAVQS